MAETRAEAIELALDVLRKAIRYHGQRQSSGSHEQVIDALEAADSALSLPREESAEGWIVREASRRPGMSWVYPLDQKREALRHLGSLNCIRRTSEMVRVRITAAPEGDAP